MWKGYVKNRRKDGGYYWVYAEVSGVYKDGFLVEYKSLRTPVEDAMKVQMQRLYDEKRENEEGIVRLVAYVKRDVVKKVKALASESGCKSDDVINDILNDTLF